jgi:dihydrofolate reductase
MPLRIRLPSISYIVARSRPGAVIGCENKLPWHLSSDLKRFKERTLGHVVIMGRKTLLSIGKPLPGRMNIVLSRTPVSDRQNTFWHLQETAVLWAENVRTALFLADVMSIAKEKKDFFVIGGSEMFEAFFEFVNKVYLTEVFTKKAPKGDAFWKFEFDLRQWQIEEEIELPSGPRDDYASRFTVYGRRFKTVRYIDPAEQYTDIRTKKDWVARQLDLIEKIGARHRNETLSIPYQYEMFSEAHPPR